jgi:hypothetical protein
MEATQAEANAIVEALRTGAVPQEGLHHFATGVDALMEVVDKELARVAEGAGLAKWVRGSYGSGKTFCTRLLCARARAQGFATTEVQISINDTPLHHLETVYRRLIERLATDADGLGAFQAVVDGWLYEVGEQVTRLQGIGEDDPTFVEAVGAKLEEKLAELSRQNAAFSQVLRAYHRASEAGDFDTAQGLLAWLGGQPHVARSITSQAGIKGNVDGGAALTFLRGLLTLLRQSDHPGLVVVLDEVETIQRMPSQTREKSLNALRQLVDMLHNRELPGLYLVVTGTPEFYDGYKGLRGAPALYQRVATDFGDDPSVDNLRAPQVRLMPFDAERLVEVGLRVRELFPAENPERVQAKVDEAFVRGLVAKVTDGFAGDVGVTPRLFLRTLVDVLDRVDLHPSFDPVAQYKLTIDESALNAQELAARHSGTAVDVGDGDGDGTREPADDAGDDAAPDRDTGTAEAPARTPRRRLDG